MSQLLLLVPAAREAAEIQEFLELRKDGLGYDFAVDFEKALTRIQEGPTSFAYFYRDIRLCSMDRFKTGIFYRFQAQTILDTHVIDLRRSPRTLRKLLRD